MSGEENVSSLIYTFRDWSELEEVFAGAYTYEESLGDDGNVAAWRFFVRHPRYPDLTATLESPDDRPGEERSIRPKRTIVDRGDTPLRAIEEIAKFSEFAVREVVQRQRGGRPRETGYRAIAERIREKGTQTAYELEYEQWLESEGITERPFPHSERDRFGTAMRREGIYFSKLR